MGPGMVADRSHESGRQAYPDLSRNRHPHSQVPDAEEGDGRGDSGDVCQSRQAVYREHAGEPDSMVSETSTAVMNALSDTTLAH